MGGDHHHHGPPKVPDYKIYKVEDVRELMMVKKALASQGLKDPWLRNEVWRYTTKSPPRLLWKQTLGRGMPLGFALAVVTTIVGKLIEDKPEHGGDAAHH